MIFYGRICFTEQNPFPQKLGILIEDIKTKHDQFIRFDYADIKELNLSNVSSTQMFLVF
jgi:hypothetical protein